MKPFNSSFWVAVFCTAGILSQSCWKDKTVKDKGLDDVHVNISPTYGVPLLDLKIKGEDVVRRINRDSATNSFFIEYNKDDYDLCVIVYDKTHIPIALSSNFSNLDTLVKYPLDFFSDLRKADGWTPLEAYVLLYADNSYTSEFELMLKKIDYEDVNGMTKSAVSKGIPKPGRILAASVSGTYLKSLAIDALIIDKPADIVFNGSEAMLDFEVRNLGSTPLSSGNLKLQPIIKVPTHIVVDGYVRRDTAAANLDDIARYAESDVISPQNITIYLKMVNAMPLDDSVQVYFVDKNYNILDSIRETDIFVKAGLTDFSTYLVHTPTVTEEEISMSQEKFKKIRDTKFLIIRERFTSNGKDAKLFKSNYMNVIMSVKVDAKVNGTISEINDEIKNYEKE